MAKRTLVSCWTQYEKLSKSYLDSDSDKEKILDKLTVLTQKTNGDRIGNALFTLFVNPYVNVCKSVEFTVEFDEGLPDWQTNFDSDIGLLGVHPITVFLFNKEVRQLIPPARNEEDFVRCRHISFLAEIGKLPSIYFLFLMVLQRVAYILEIAHLEKRGGVIEIAEDESYHTMLWAFKELENFAKRTYGLNIRPHFGISWYEAEWITGR